MKLLLLCFVLIFSTVEINSSNVEDIQLFSQCDQTVTTGVSTCMQYFSPIKFVTDFLNGDKESLCCTHFRHTACINGVRDAVRLAKAANLCPDSFADDLVGTFTDSSINNYIRKSCKSFNTGKCVMDSVGDVVNTIQGFFVPQQQKPVIPQIIKTVPQLFDRNGGNSYSVDDNYRNHNYNTDRTSLFNPFREIINGRRNQVVVPTTQKPFINQSVRDLYDRQYIPEASDVRPTKEISDENKTEDRNPLRSLFSGLIDSTEVSDNSKDNSGDPSLLETISNIFNSGVNSNRNKRNRTNGQNFFTDIFNLNGTDSTDTIVKDITDSIN